MQEAEDSVQVSEWQHSNSVKIFLQTEVVVTFWQITRAKKMQNLFWEIFCPNAKFPFAWVPVEVE